MTDIFSIPDTHIFASHAKNGEVEPFPDIERGWGISFEQTEGKPPMEWFNALFMRNDQAISYLRQRGIAEWISALDYPVGALVQHQQKVYLALAENQNKQPDKNASVWQEWGVTPDEVLLIKNQLAEIKLAGEEAQKNARENIGAIGLTDIPNTDLTGYVPSSRTINGFALTEDIVLKAKDIGAAEEMHQHDDRYAGIDHTHSFADIRDIPYASLNQAGIVKLIDAVNNASITEAATANSIKMLRDMLIGIPLPWPHSTPPDWGLKFNGAEFDPERYPLLALRYPNHHLPDLRADFLRGLDDGRGIDVNRAVVSEQESTIVPQGGDRQDSTTTGPTSLSYYELRPNAENFRELVFGEKANNRNEPLLRILFGQYGNSYVDWQNYAMSIRPRNTAFSYITIAG